MVPSPDHEGAGLRCKVSLKSLYGRVRLQVCMTGGNTITLNSLVHSGSSTHYLQTIKEKTDYKKYLSMELMTSTYQKYAPNSLSVTWLRGRSIENRQIYV